MAHEHADRIGVSGPADRWMAEIRYIDRPSVTVTFQELEDLDHIVEAGPDWNTIEEIKVTLNRPTIFYRRGE